ncbi:probable RNA-binding protein 46 isoform X1 [Aricia agestis]|uniref:probable RNA-binding protein 46 isoform X1 n=1 Tax=Aricia agestis TaxID=91739 RepID=UPI001C20BCE9|nr:probable RNA-binding protein 46 isoform X1 [Aricia agestis]
MDKEGLALKLLKLTEKTGYDIVQHNGQRRFGPPRDWTGPPPPKGCEIFIGRLPREVYEDELVPLFSKVGKIYEMRLMMDFSGSNRGYAFVTYTTQAEAAAAIRQLNGYEIRPGINIGVVMSVDNCRLFIGNIPPTRSKEEIYEELKSRVPGVVNVILYKNRFDRNTNRRFAFAEFSSHRAAAMARRALVPGNVKLWGQEVTVDWAEPEPHVDEDLMRNVKVLYARNFEIRTTPEAIKKIFESAINNKIERVKKIYDYAFIHFYDRKHAELAMAKLQNIEIDGSVIEICWAKPVDRELYKIQKLSRGNAKFNKSFDLNQTLLLYKQHLAKMEFDKGSKDEGIGSAYASESTCGSPLDTKPRQFINYDYPLAPRKLEAMCNRYSWLPPKYYFKKFLDINGAEWWVCSVELPLVGYPLFSAPKNIGPFTTRHCFSYQQAHVEAAETILHVLKCLNMDILQQAAIQPVYTPLVSPNCLSVPCNVYQTSTMQVPIQTIPTIWQPPA